MKKPRHKVSDHAVLRFLERAQGVDIEALRCELGRRVDAATEGHVGMNAVIIDGFRYAIQDGVVTTTWEQHLPLRGAGRHKRREAE